ncbi:MAG TPA: CPBP family intramembrane glutamic endopeptidase [Acidobacteriaceae bacterium]|nr:CPBP family intramembrane glutamic endopeptidase [Acidobacteriaceae bacterium]
MIRTPGIELQHALAVALLLLLPAWDYLESRKLRKAAALKLPYYKRLILVLWILAGIAAWSTGLRLFVAHRSADGIPWLLGSVTTKVVAGTLLALFFAAALLPGIRGARSSRARQAYVREYRQALAFFLPNTAEELHWFTVLSVTAGVCEELLFRGFLISYLHHGALALSWTLALVVSSIGFGLNHLYQGPSGVFSTALAGFAFALLFLVTGNLASSILMHIAVNLQLVLVLRPAERTASPRPKVRR